MATDSFRVSTFLPVAPKRLYEAWLNWQEHSAFVGGDATADPRVGGRHSVWEGYAEGTFLELDNGKRILETWRATDFPSGAPHSQVEILFEKEEGGTKLTIVHSEIPKGQGKRFKEGWQEHYFTPMKAYFAKLAGKKTEGQAAPAPKPIAAITKSASAPITAASKTAPKSSTSAQSTQKPRGKAPSDAKAKKAQPKAQPKLARKPQKTSTAKKAAPKKPAPKKKTAQPTKPIKKAAPKKAIKKKPAKAKRR